MAKRIVNTCMASSHPNIRWRFVLLFGQELGAETSYMGYDSNDEMYTYDSFNTLGEADHAKGNVDRDTGPGRARQGWAHRP
jgi:hypothetical protein